QAAHLHAKSDMPLSALPPAHQVHATRSPERRGQPTPCSELCSPPRPVATPDFRDRQPGLVSLGASPASPVASQPQTPFPQVQPVGLMGLRSSRFLRLCRQPAFLA